MKIFRLAFLAILAVSLFTSCKKSSDSLAESIPAQSQSVTHINMESLIKKSNYNLFENPSVKRGINMAKALLKDQSAVKLIEEFEENSGAFGVTLNKDMFFFSKGSYYGFILPVNDAKKIKESMSKFGLDAASIKEEKGIYSFSQSSALDVAWNNDKLMVLIQQPTAGNDSIQLSATKLLTLDKKESMLSDQNFEKFLQDKQDISVYFSMGMYADLSSKLSGSKPSINPIDQESSQEAADGLKKLSEKFKGVSFGSFISFENGKITAHTQYYFATPEAEANLKKFLDETTGTISDKYLQFVPQSPIFSFMANIKGTGYYSLLNETGLLKAIDTQVKDTGIDIKSLIEAINGNVVLSLDNLTLTTPNKGLSDMDAMLTMQDKTGKPKMKFYFLAELSSGNKLENIIDSIITKQPGMIKKEGKGAYTIKDGDFSGYLGVKNNTFYFTTEASTPSALDHLVEKSGYSDKVKGKNAYYYGDIRPLKQFILEYYSQEARPQNAQFKPIVEDGLSLIETIEGFSKPDRSNEFTINFTDKKDNSLASIFQYIDKVLTKVGASQGL